MNRFLRSLTLDQQISLMFVLLFGTLILASAIGLLLSLRERESGDPAIATLREYRAAVARSWWMMGVFWLAWTAGQLGALIVAGLISLLTLREFISLTPTHRSDHKALVLSFFVILPFQYWLLGAGHYDLFSVFIPVYAFLAVPLVSSLGNDPKGFLERNAKLQWGIMVCVYGLSHLPALWVLAFPHRPGHSAFLVFFLVAVVQTCMVLQHITSRWLARTPTLPAISARFHWHSWAIGVLGGGILGGLLSGITPLKPGQGLAMGLIACAAGSLGHLVMKAIKRDRGVPHWGGQGRAVTGASGVLDRVDALCFAAPVFFQSLRWYFGV
jgi:phosphatidate cytidylyltransferase